MIFWNQQQQKFTSNKTTNDVLLFLRVLAINKHDGWMVKCNESSDVFIGEGINGSCGGGRNYLIETIVCPKNVERREKRR